MCGHVAKELRYCCTAPDLLSYWKDRFHWSESQVALVDLLGTQKALVKMSPDAQRRAQKLRCGWLQKFQEWKTSKTLIKALHSGALAWIEGREIPDVAELALPSTTMGQLVRKAYIEQTSLGWNLLFRGFWSISWRKGRHRTMNSQRAPITGGTQIMAKVGHVEHRCGCSIFIIWLGWCEMPMSTEQTLRHGD
jgi:hypothetical protein